MSFLQIPIGTYPNTFLGYESSISITTGISNTSFGNRTLNANTSGNWNSAFGNLALEFNQTGTENSAFGDRALRVSRGSGNSGFGSSVMLSLFTGLDNSAFGTNALYRIVSGNRNAAFGANALSFPFSAESENSAFGYGSLNGLNGGNRNSAFGYQSGVAITSGSKNTILGSYSGNQNGLDIRTLSNYIVISDGDGNPRIWVDNTGLVNFPGGSVLPGGTANGVLYLNGSKVVTSGSALTFDGTNIFSLSTTGAQATMRALASAGQTATLQIAANGNGGGVTSLDIVQDSSSNGYVFQRANAPLIFGVNNAEQMRLTSTGLGIGTSSPATKLNVRGAGDQARYEVATATDARHEYFRNGTREAYINWDANIFTIAATQASGVLTFASGGTTERMRLDSSGNLGLGVTPSAWASSAKALDFTYPSVAMDTTGAAVFGFNAYNSSGTTWNYKTTDEAALFTVTNAGAFTWRQAVSGTAGNAISFTQAMTLDASGNLFIGGTAGAEKLNIIANTATSGLEKGLAVSNDVDSNFFISITGTAATDKRAVIGPTSSTALVFQTNGSARARIPAAGGMVIGNAAIATNATDGFLYVPGCAGTPTGTPTAYTGRVPIVVDTTNNKLYFYSGGAWRDAGP